MKLISISKEFSEFPAGRFIEDGPFSGERFRDELLAPALNEFDQVTVNIDGTLGFGSSFLEEAFGGLIRVHKFSVNELNSKLIIVGSMETYKRRIWSYIQSAAK